MNSLRSLAIGIVKDLIIDISNARWQNVSKFIRKNYSCEKIAIALCNYVNAFMRKIGIAVP